MRSRYVVLVVVVATVLVMTVPAASAESETGGGDPRFLTAPTDGDPENVAKDHLREEAATYGLRPADLNDLFVMSSHTSQHNNVTHVNLNQRFHDHEVFGGHATVNIAEDGSIVHVGNSMVNLPVDTVARTPQLDAVQAVEAAADALGLDQPQELVEVSQSRIPGEPDADTVALSDGGIADQPISAQLGWHPTGEQEAYLAWQVVIDDSESPSMYNATVDAADGELLDADDWTNESNIEDFHTLERSGTQSSSAASSLAANVSGSPDPVEDGSSYRVFEFPKESPNDGGQTVVTEPADATASPDGWHDTTGTPEPDYTTTRGNNVHAYTDRDDSGIPDPGSDPDGGSDLTFDFEADLNEHPQTYADAAVTNLFYWNNLIHDVMHLYGFDEPSGNFQVNNYGRGGVGGDDVRAEAMDGGGHSNANFMTPAHDGGRPRMQMYLWPGLQFGMPNLVSVDAGPGAGTYPANYARFTPAPTSEGFAGDIVLVNDGSDQPTAGCEPHTLPAGAIALVDAGACSFLEKVQNAEDAGASAVIVTNDEEGDPETMSGSMEDPVGIPAVMVSQADGEAIKDGAPAPGRVHRNTFRRPMRDGDLEAGIIIHEYSHGVSNRLTGGPGINCLTGDQRMGEGWSDYHAIAMLIDPELDDPDGARGMGSYAMFEESRQGNGIRPAPYSRNMDIQPATYEMIGTESWLNGETLAIPHGVGHVWAAVLWDMTWDLIDVHGFNENIYESWDSGGNNLAFQLVMDGLKFQGCDPGFLDGRDAILGADLALTGGDNHCLLWSSFTRRGLGHSAEQAPDNSRDGNTESFDVPPACEA